MRILTGMILLTVTAGACCRSEGGTGDRSPFCRERPNHLDRLVAPKSLTPSLLRGG